MFNNSYAIKVYNIIFGKLIFNPLIILIFAISLIVINSYFYRITSFELLMKWYLYWNIFAFITYAVDRYQVLKRSWRINELVFYEIPIIGGPFGSLLGIYLLRHKISHNPIRYSTIISTILHTIILIIYAPYWPNWTGINGKTFWDFLEVFVIPFSILVGGFLFSQSERRLDRQIAEDNQQESALQIYIDKITYLLLEREIIKSDPADKTRDIARIWTLTTLRRLNGERKGILIRFLYDSDLISSSSIIDLEDVDLSMVVLKYANLTGICLRGSILSDANLYNTILANADLSNTYMLNVDIRGADLSNTVINGTKFTVNQYDKYTKWPLNFDLSINE